MAEVISTTESDKPVTTTMDSEKQTAAPRHHDTDAALEFLHAEDTTVTEVNEKDLVRKIDWRIVPLMCKYRAS